MDNILIYIRKKALFTFLVNQQNILSQRNICFAQIC